MFDNNMIDLITKNVIDNLNKEGLVKNTEAEIKIGVSARHVHLSEADIETLFGRGYQLKIKKYLMGDQFAAEECVTIVSPSLRSIEGVRVLGPARKRSQVEISRTDTFKLKISPPVRPSGELDGSAPIAIVGPKGSVFLKEGAIIANRHIHFSPEDAAKYGIKDNDVVDVEIASQKPTRYFDVQVRVSKDFDTEMHIDTDDANAAGIKSGEIVTILK